MTATLLLSPVWQVVDAAGPVAGATASFFVSGGLTAAAVYTDATRATAIAQPVTADATGRFQAIWLDPAVIYRVRCQDAGGALIADLDPVAGPLSIGTDEIADGAVTGAKLDGGAVAASLGYTPLSKGGDAMAGPLRLGTGTTAFSDQAGYLGLPTTIRDANYTFAVADAGCSIGHDDATACTWTIPTNAAAGFPVGTVINCFNTGAGAVAIARAAGVSLRLSSTDAEVTLAQYGDAFLHKIGTDAWSICGKGLS
jgi:hypothetical protein